MGPKACIYPKPSRQKNNLRLLQTIWCRIPANGCRLQKSIWLLKPKHHAAFLILESTGVSFQIPVVYLTLAYTGQSISQHWY
jgi:hypothetical protein